MSQLITCVPTAIRRKSFSTEILVPSFDSDFVTIFIFRFSVLKFDRSTHFRTEQFKVRKLLRSELYM